MKDQSFDVLAWHRLKKDFKEFSTIVTGRRHVESPSGRYRSRFKKVGKVRVYDFKPRVHVMGGVN